MTEIPMLEQKLDSNGTTDYDQKASIYWQHKWPQHKTIQRYCPHGSCEPVLRKSSRCTRLQRSICGHEQGMDGFMLLQMQGKSQGYTSRKAIFERIGWC